MNGPKILVIDDEPAIRRFLRTSLLGQGYSVIEAETGASGARAAIAEKPDAVILDLGLPDLDGQQVIAAIRAKSVVPIVVLSIRDDEAGKVAAFDAGVDDYVTKPFGMAELLARLRTALRHRLHEEGSEAVVQSGDLAIDLLRHTARLRGETLKLSPKEFDLLALLAKHAGKVLTHKFILTRIWGPAQADDVQYLRVYMRQLRQKIETDPARPRYLLTEPGVGYRLESEA